MHIGPQPNATCSSPTGPRQPGPTKELTEFDCLKSSNLKRESRHLLFARPDYYLGAFISRLWFGAAECHTTKKFQTSD